MSDYEMYCDSGYYYMWCVRNTNDKRFDSPTSFHFETEQEAKTFMELISKAR